VRLKLKETNFPLVRLLAEEWLCYKAE